MDKQVKALRKTQAEKRAAADEARTKQQQFTRKCVSVSPPCPSFPLWCPNRVQPQRDESLVRTTPARPDESSRTHAPPPPKKHRLLAQADLARTAEEKVKEKEQAMSK